VTKDSQSIDYLRRAYGIFLSVNEYEHAQSVSDLIRKISGGCTATSHDWPISGLWCYCGRERWTG
jgi:hypothetical protein